MPLPNHRTLPPKTTESPLGYAMRLEAVGHDELFIRNALPCHFAMSLADLSTLCQHLPTARLRHVERLKKLLPNHSTSSLTQKLAQNLGLSTEQAGQWFKAYFQSTGMARDAEIRPTHTHATALQ